MAKTVKGEHQMSAKAALRNAVVLSTVVFGALLILAGVASGLGGANGDTADHAGGAVAAQSIPRQESRSASQAMHAIRAIS